MSRIKPLFKSGDKSLFSNYRLISLLPSLSKFFERVIFDELLGYFTNNNLLCLDQFGFRPGHSTELAVLRLVNHLITQMDMCKMCILLEKLQYYGVTVTSLSLLDNYLSDRCQYVETNGIDQIPYLLLLVSNRALFWGHYYFLIYINDLPMVSDVFNMLMYADDTTLYCNIDQNVSEEVINNELSNVSQWLAANKLSINVTKTNYI